MQEKLKIGLVGPCASGKSTVRARLEAVGYRVHHIAQEHSFVKEMWQKITNPDVLIFLDATHETILERRRKDFMDADEYAEQQRRLRHAREHADLYIATDGLSPDVIFNQIMGFLGDK